MVYRLVYTFDQVVRLWKKDGHTFYRFRNADHTEFVENEYSVHVLNQKGTNMVQYEVLLNDDNPKNYVLLFIPKDSAIVKKFAQKINENKLWLSRHGKTSNKKFYVAKIDPKAFYGLYYQNVFLDGSVDNEQIEPVDSEKVNS